MPEPVPEQLNSEQSEPESFGEEPISGAASEFDEELPEYIEELGVDDTPEPEMPEELPEFAPAGDKALDDVDASEPEVLEPELPAQAPESGESEPEEAESEDLLPLSFEEEPEDIWSEDTSEPEAPHEGAPQQEAVHDEGAAQGVEEEPVEQSDLSDRQAEGGEAVSTVQSEAGADEPLLGTPTARLLEYLKSLSEDLPPEKREEFRASGLEEKIDGLIGSLSKSPEEEEKVETDSAAAFEPSLLAAGEKRRQAADVADAGRRADPRRSQVARRSGAERRGTPDRRIDDRRKAERRVSSNRRVGADRRDGERRAPPPVMDFAEHIPAGAASLVVSAEGLPTEIAGVPVSPRLAKLIEIMRRDKRHNGD
jgi:hypothetical protein